MTWKKRNKIRFFSPYCFVEKAFYLVRRRPLPRRRHCPPQAEVEDGAHVEDHQEGAGHREAERLETNAFIVSFE